MLHLITGVAGTGKTVRLFEEIEKAARDNSRVILLVPEQLSFESEKRLHSILGPKLALNVEVLSFTRLCNSVFRELGGLASTAITPAAKLLLMSIAVDEMKDSLVVYKKSLSSTSFLQMLVDTCAEFKTAGVLPDGLQNAAKLCDGMLADKLGELSAIYSAYQALLSQGYSDSDDDLIRACALLETNDYFGSFTVFVDGFTTFMAAEFELLGHIIRQSPDAWFALTLDSIQDTSGGMGVFSPVQSAASRLNRMAISCGTAVSLPEKMVEPVRYKSSQPLAHVAQNFMQTGAQRFETDAAPYIKLHGAMDIYSEMDFVAANIIKLVRDEGLRFREVAVVARDTAPYIRALQTAFERFGIPYFNDTPEDAENHPLLAGVVHAVDAVRSNFDTGAVLLLAKSPVMGLDVQRVSEIENYCYCWNVRGAAWLDDFTANPSGLAGALTDEDIHKLSRINEVREKLAQPLKKLKSALEKGSGYSFAKGLAAFLDDINASGNLTAWAEKLPQDEKKTFLSESALIWDSLMDIINIFGSVLGDVSMKRARLCELLRLAIGTAEVGLPPQTLDQVLVGKADRMRPVDIRAAFVIGAVEGEFPALPGQNGAFSDEERRRLIEMEVEISAPSLQKSVLEKFFAYFALTIPSEYLCVSWPGADLAGQEKLPSVIVSQLEWLFPSLVREPFAGDDQLTGERPAFELLSMQYGSGSEMEATLKAYFEQTDRHELLQRMHTAHTRPLRRLADRQIARALFGGRLKLSPTRVERYYSCPFRFFAADGLKLRPRQKVDFTPMESGNVMHNVLQVMVQRHGGKGLATLSDEQLETEIGDIIYDYLAERVQDVKALPPRFRYLFDRLIGTLMRLMRHLGNEFMQSEFEPVAVELPINSEDGVQPLQLVTADGVSVTVEGIVDRVDIMEKNGERYVRVVDYKSGAQSFALEDILSGLNMQMLLYLFTIEENGKDKLENAIPAGVLYMPVSEHFVSTSRDVPVAQVSVEKAKQWRMSGLLLQEEIVLHGMEQEVAGVFIPAKLKKNGEPDARSSVADKAKLGRLSRKVKELVVQMASSITDGKIEAHPVVSGRYDTCKYCEFKTICGFEAGDSVREIAKMSSDEIFKLLEDEQRENEIE